MKVLGCPLKNFERCITIACAWYDESNNSCSILSIADILREIDMDMPK